MMIDVVGAKPNGVVDQQVLGKLPSTRIDQENDCIDVVQNINVQWQ